MTIVDILKLTKSKERSKFDLDTIDFDTIEVHDIKYLPPYFDGDMLLVYIAPYGIRSSTCVWLVHGWHGQDVHWTPLMHNHYNKPCPFQPWYQ